MQKHFQPARKKKRGPGKRQARVERSYTDFTVAEKMPPAAALTTERLNLPLHSTTAAANAVVAATTIPAGGAATRTERLPGILLLLTSGAYCYGCWCYCYVYY